MAFYVTFMNCCYLARIKQRGWRRCYVCVGDRTKSSGVEELLTC